MREKLSEAYQSLVGEIIDKDIYHMRDVGDIVSVNDPLFVHEKGHKRPFDFIPEIIFDLGANIGLFSGYARQLFPDALIISVEPDKNNCEMFRELVDHDEKIILIEKAIGVGKVWKSTNSKNGSGENYLTSGIAYPEKQMIELGKQAVLYEESEVKTITLNDLVNEYVKKDEKFIIKIDVEGNEQVIFSNEKEMSALKKADYITGELHYFSVDSKANKVIRQKINESLFELQFTHNVEINHLNFYATKK